MSDKKVLPLNTNYIPKPDAILKAIRQWLVSFFHIHEWEDESKHSRLNSDGSVGAVMYVQICKTPGCRARRSQILTSTGFKQEDK